MEKGHIKDEDITASSAFDFKSVGPHLARLDQDSDGGAWCPKKTIGKKYKHTSEHVHVKNNSVFHDTPESYEIVEFDDAIGRWEKKVLCHLPFGFQNGSYHFYSFSFLQNQVSRSGFKLTFTDPIGSPELPLKEDMAVVTEKSMPKSSCWSIGDLR